MFTGFGKNAKNILRYLYKTGKYNIVEFSNAKLKEEECLDSLPWKAYGTLPKQEILNLKPESERDEDEKKKIEDITSQILQKRKTLIEKETELTLYLLRELLSLYKQT